MTYPDLHVVPFTAFPNDNAPTGDSFSTRVKRPRIIRRGKVPYGINDLLLKCRSIVQDHFEVGGDISFESRFVKYGKHKLMDTEMAPTPAKPTPKPVQPAGVAEEKEEGSDVDSEVDSEVDSDAEIEEDEEGDDDSEDHEEEYNDVEDPNVEASGKAAPSGSEAPEPTHEEQQKSDADKKATAVKLKKKIEFVTIGLLGHPNSGKSSVINALAGKKVVSVSKSPGHTKHFQTIFLNKTTRLCDCPGLVFPAVDMPQPLQILCGLYPIAQVREPYSVVQFLAERVPLEIIYGLLPRRTEEEIQRAIKFAAREKVKDVSVHLNSMEDSENHSESESEESASSSSEYGDSVYTPPHRWSAWEICEVNG